MRSPLPFQLPAVEWTKGRDHAFLAMDKRLGKCHVSLRWASQWVRPAKNNISQCRGLVVAPNSAQPDWIEEFKSEDFQLALLSGLSPEEKLNTILYAQTGPGPFHFLTSPQSLFKSSGRLRQTCQACSGAGAFGIYEDGDPGTVCQICDGKGFLGKKQPPDPHLFALFPWDYVIWDEGTNLKNPKSQLNKVAGQLFCNIAHRCLLTGEPAPEGALDLFEPMKWTYGRWMGRTNYYKWKEENFTQLGYDVFPKPGRLSLIRRSFQAQAYTLTRAEAGIHVKRTYETRWVDLPEKVRQVYNHIEKHMELPTAFSPESETGRFLSAVEATETNYPIVRDNWLYQLAGGFPKASKGLHSEHKLAELLSLLSGEYAVHRLVVLFRYNAELHAAWKTISGRKYGGCGWINGDLPVLKRKEVVERFRAGAFRILLMQAKVATFGIDLSCSDTMIRYSMPDDWMTVSQSMDRQIHPKKINELRTIDIVCHDTLEEDQAQARREKGITARHFMNKMKQLQKLRLERKFGKVGAK